MGFLFTTRQAQRPARIAGWLIAASGLALLAA
jgi:hypothetical protein